MGDDNNRATVNYLKNTNASKGRTVRIEVVGGVTESEKHFLDGISLLTAGTLSKNCERHVIWVSDLMTKLLKHIIRTIKNETGTTGTENTAPPDNPDKPKGEGL